MSPTEQCVKKPLIKQEYALEQGSAALCFRFAFSPSVLCVRNAPLVKTFPDEHLKVEWSLAAVLCKCIGVTVRKGKKAMKPFRFLIMDSERSCCALTSTWVSYSPHPFNVLQRMMSRFFSPSQWLLCLVFFRRTPGREEISPRMSREYTQVYFTSSKSELREFYTMFLFLSESHSAVCGPGQVML